MGAVNAVVGRREPVAGAAAPRVDHAVDGARIQVGPVSEDHDRSGHFVAQSREPTAKRRAGASLPVLTAHDAGVRLNAVRARDDDDVGHRARPKRVEHAREEQPLFRRAETRCRPGGEDDGGYDVSTLTFEMTTFAVGRWFTSPSVPILSTTSRPFVTVPMIA